MKKNIKKKKLTFIEIRKETNKQKDKKPFDIVKLNDLLEFIYKFYPFTLAFFLLLDFATMTNVFNIESGYFNTIFLGDKTISLSVVFIYMLIPLILMLAYMLGILSSLYISIYFKFKLNNFFRMQTEDSIKGILLSLTITLFVLVFMYVFPFINNNLVSFSFLTIYGLFIMVAILFNSAIGTLTLISNKFIKTKFNFVGTIVWTCIILLITTDIFQPFEGYKVFSFLYAIFYFSYTIFFDSYIKTLLKPKDKNQKKLLKKLNIGKIILILFVFVYFALFERMNITIWGKPITINNKKSVFKDPSINLIFNRGMLTNNKSDIKFKIESVYINSLEEIEKLYLKKVIKDKERTLSSNVQYLDLGNNLKMYFESINNKQNTIIYLIEEKKFTNIDKSSFNLVELSSYRTESKE